MLNKMKSESNPLASQQKRIEELENALQLHLDFLGSLPEGWLGKTCGDIGLLNEAYIASRKLGMKIR